MLNAFIKDLWRFLIVLLLQVLVFNHVHIMGYATPLIFVYFILLFPSDTPRWVLLLWGFAMGLLVDIFSNTPGVASADLTVMALLQPVLLKIFSPRDEDDAIYPSVHSLGWAPFTRYATIAVIIHEIIFFLLEAFSFFNWLEILINIGGSSLLTILIIVAFESIRNKGKAKKSA